MNRKSSSLATLALAAAMPVLAQDRSVAPIAATTAPPAAASTGLLNDWLRGESDEFDPWDVGGSFRGRYENKQGFGIPGIAGSVDFRAQGAKVDNDYFLTRTRLHIGYTDMWWSAFAEGQSSTANNDARYAYADAPPIAGTVKRLGYGPESDTIDLHQAYVAFGNLKEFPLTAKVGRQELSYGEERLIGAVNWNNIGRSFDAAKLHWQNNWFGADFFTGHPVIPQDGKFDTDNPEDWLSGVYATSTMIPRNTLEVYMLARNASRDAVSEITSPQFPQPTARDVYTVGGRVKSKPGELSNWDYAVEGAYQFGNFADPTQPALTAPLLTQNAFMFVTQGGYTFADVWATPRLGLEFVYSSGDSHPNNGTHGTFDNLFPTNHKFYGYMDFFSLQNIQDLRSILQLKPMKKLTVSLEGHNFWLANGNDFLYTVGGTPRTTGGYGIHPNYSTYVGSELDVTAAYAITRFAQVEAGYGHFFTGDYIQQTLAGHGGSQDANWFYTQLTVTF